MEDVTRELQTRQRIQSIYTKTQGDFGTKEAYDDYLEAVEDIIFKLTNNIDVAEVEQQVQDYIRQQAVDGVKDTKPFGNYVPTTTSTVIQPQPLTAVQMDADGRILPAATPTMSREKWKLMAQASGWRQDIATHRALQDAFTTVFAY